MSAEVVFGVIKILSKGLLSPLNGVAGAQVGDGAGAGGDGGVPVAGSVPGPGCVP